MPAETEIQPQPVVTTTAPVARISSGEVAQPYEQMARALDKTGDSLERVAEPLAERAGAQAVTRDAQGNIQVEHMPIFGLAGEAYSRAMKVAYFTEVDGDAKRKDIEIRAKFRDEPQKYEAAAKEYTDGVTSKAAQVVGPDVANELKRSIESTTTYTFRGLQNEKERLDLQRADNTIKAGLQSAKDDALALARGGVDPNDPAFQATLGKYATLQGELLKNPRLAYTQEQAKFEFDQLQGQLAGARHIYHVDQTYKTQGYQAALDDAKSILTNENYKLTPAERQQFYTHAVGEIRANEAIRKQDVGQAQLAFRELKTAADLGAKVTPDEVESLRQAFKSANYPAGIAMVDAAFAHKDLHDDFGRMPLSDQARELNTIRGAAAARSAYQFFTGQGYRPEEAAGIVGNLVFESGMRPGAVGDAGTSAGLAQFHNERLTALKTYAQSVGKPWTDPQTQYEFIDRELHSSEGGALAALRAAKSPEEAAAVFAARYERPASNDYGARQSLARTVFGGAPSDGSGGPGVTSWLIANRAHTVDTSAKQAWKEIWSDWSAGKGAVPPAARVNEILDAARASGDIDLQARISADADLMDKVERASQLPITEQQALATELERRQRLGEQPYPGAELVEKQLQARTNAIREGLKANPIATAVQNFPDKLKTPAPLDLKDMDQFRAGLAVRAQIATVAAANWQTGPLPALDEQDVQNIKAALNTPDPAAKAQVYGALATLPPDVRGATLKKLGGGDVNGMAEAAAGSLMRSAPDIATSIFRGQAAMKADKKWDPTAEQGGKASFDDDLQKSMPASIFPIQARTDPTGPYATFSAMVKARYADLSAQAGDTKYSADRVKAAVSDVTGGVLYHNGAPLIAPARGMTQGQFDGVLQGVTDRDLAGVTTQNGAPVSADYLRAKATLQSAGDGRYYVALGRSTAAPIYAYTGATTEPTANVQKFVLDLRGRQPAPVSAKPGEFVPVAQ